MRRSCPAPTSGAGRLPWSDPARSVPGTRSRVPRRKRLPPQAAGPRTRGTVERTRSPGFTPPHSGLAEDDDVLARERPQGLHVAEREEGHLLADLRFAHLVDELDRHV